MHCKRNQICYGCQTPWEYALGGWLYRKSPPIVPVSPRRSLTLVGLLITGLTFGGITLSGCAVSVPTTQAEPIELLPTEPVEFDQGDGDANP